MKFARYVFYFEAIFINLLVGLLVFFAPGVFVSTFYPGSLPAVPLEIMRWYGVLLFVLSYAMLRALPSGNEGAVRIFVEALLLGDIVHLVATVLFFINGGPLVFGSAVMVFFSTFLACVRIFWLRNMAASAPVRVENRL